MVIIIAVEGDPAWTEHNFFEGLKYWIKSPLVICSFSKAKQSRARTLAINEKFKQRIRKHIQDINNASTADLFFIGDGDARHDFNAMENTKNIITSYVKERFPKIKVVDQILRGEGAKFEDLYERVLKQYKFPASVKKSSDKGMFNRFGEKANWFIENSCLNWQRIIKDMRCTSHPHLKIFKQLAINEGANIE